MKPIKIIFKSGNEIRISLYDDETFEGFWKKIIESKYFLSTDIMFSVDEVEYSEEIE